MENFKLLFQIYIRPAFAFSEIMDKGSWLFATVAVLVVSFAFQYAVNSKIMQTYAVSQMDYYSANSGFDNVSLNDGTLTDAQLAEAEYYANADVDKELNRERRPFPVISKNIFYFFSFYSSFFTPLISLSLFYIPATIILLALFAQLGNIGTVLRRDYATLATCSLMAWVAAHLPFAIAAYLLNSQNIDGGVYLGFWLASGLIFGGLMVFALRTVFGVDYGVAVLTIAVSWIFYSLGTYIFQFISPWLFSPFLLFFAVIYLGGYLGSEVRGFGNAMRQKRDLKRFLNNATVNPNDADAHLQLGLIYKQRRQDEKALEHFTKAYEIDKEEIDANYELGKIARQNGNLQKAIEHFSVVVGQNEKYSLSEIWREIGATYLEADMLDEAQNALEKFEIKRPFDAEGLYYLGKLYKQKGETVEANEMFSRSIEAVKTAAYYRRGELRQWSKLSQKEL
ncbi:MAG: tetratricopeptide repeat protein [Acidobacteriota bacterium]|nr:tetratricopeptide repeat protein [Acidobacteriota bacterium]